MPRTISAMLAALLVVSLAGPVRADSGGDITVRADLDGVPIAVSDIPDFFCHDRDFPAIHCFATAIALERDLASLDAAAGPLAATASDYVVVYSELAYGGSSMHVSQDYNTLVVVGWNDRIRSCRGLNGARGVFWTDWFATGDDLAFCCNVLDPSLPAAFDRKITSVYRR